MPTVDELLNDSNEVTTCTINPDTREIIVPEKYKVLGVFSDEKVTKIPFTCPRVVGNNVDLTEYNLYINYQNASGASNAYLIDDLVVSGDNITFSWLLSRYVTFSPGVVKYSFCAKKLDGDTISNEWNTTIATGLVIQGLEATREIIEENPDIIEALISKSHTHENKAVLDKFSETDGKPTYDGIAIGSGGTGGASTAEDVSYTNTQLPTVKNVKTALDELVPKSHTHSNKDTLDKLSVTGGKLQYNGSDVGLKGDKGNDGYTPKKGVDYFTSEDIAGLNIPSVDQTYTPDSENAQSGKAVAEAVLAEEKRADNAFANALKGNKSDTAILLDDISPVSHEMSVKISSDTVTDLTTVKVSRCGKNLIPFPYRDLKLGTSTTNGIDFTVYDDGSILINGTATSNTTKYLYQNATGLLGLKSGVTISGSKNASDDIQQAIVYFTCNYYDSAGTMQVGVQASIVASAKTTITDDWKGLGIYLHIPSGKILNNLLIKPQLEIGTTATEYEPYSAPIEYTPNADGTVNGVTSLYPSTTLTTDTNGVLIDCEYNRDINKALVGGALDELVPKPHTHANKDTLDKLSDSDGKLQYNGSDISVTKNGVITALGYTPEAVSAQVSTGSNIALADNTEYRLADVTTLNLSYPTGNFECWMRLTFAASGNITVTLPNDTEYLGATPNFKNGETWELSFKDKVLVAQKVGDSGAISAPVKGVDYWTESDKQEIVNDVIAALPDGTEVSY